jgi:glutamine synthetase
MIVLNTIVANQLISFKKTIDARMAKGEGKDEAILKELQVLIKASKKIRFEGNGYGEEWRIEAEKRGLSNRKDTPRALQVYHEKWVEDLFQKMGVLNPRELEARREIEFEGYVLKIQIESRLMGDLVNNNFMPAAIEYQNKLIQNIQGIINVFGEKKGKEMAKAQIDMLQEVNHHLNAMKAASERMLKERKKANAMDDAEHKALAYCDHVKVHFDEIRYHADKLEMIVEDELWPLPKFRELLFIR